MTATIPSITTKAFLIIATLCLLPWLWIQSQISLNGDTIWLLTAAQRMLSGETMSTAYYEVNPPLSILYHLPPVLLVKLLPIPLHYITFVFFCSLIALSTLALNTILKHWTFLSTNQRLVIITAYLAANTYATTIFLGEREHIVLLGLMPMLAVQLSLTKGYELPTKLLWSALVLGVVAVLIKPHFGLLPTAALVHRMAIQKRFWNIIRDPDFTALAIGTLSYMFIIWTFFQDYLTVILPDVLEFYITNKNYTKTLLSLLNYGFLFTVFLAADFYLTSKKAPDKRFAPCFYIGALLCLVPVAVQMKGFPYQLIPAIAFFYCGFGLSLYNHISGYLKIQNKYYGPAIILSLLLLAFLYSPPLWSYPKHNDYSTLPLSQEIAQCNMPPCTFFIINDSMEIVHATAYYNGLENASRFPTLWFLPALIKQNTPLSHNRVRFGNMIADDIEKYRPQIIAVGRYKLVGDTVFDFPAFFSVSKKFNEQWKHYRKNRTIRFNQKPYFKGTALEHDQMLEYDIYLNY